MSGFVYILRNEYMPDLIKIGCSERSPRLRADELSKHTGVPAPFQVLCYAEFDNFQAVERNMHEWCKEHRVNTQREFFQGCLRWAVQLLYFHRARHAFADCTAGRRYVMESELAREVCCELGENYFDDLPDPWEAKDERQAREEAAANVAAFVESVRLEDEPEPESVVAELGGAQEAA